jgi:DNA-nicking Smr family endonuclease
MSRKPHTLSATELRLWRQVMRHVQPLATPRVTQKPRFHELTMPEDYPWPPDQRPVAPSPAEIGGTKDPRPAPAMQKRPPPLVPLDRSLRRDIARGKQTIDGVLDLHGLRQSEAHDRLRRFLSRAQADGASVVIVVTGKGSRSQEDVTGLGERGVLRRMVPIWLRLPDMRALVISFEEAAPHQGGGGALYVHLRRRRGDMP